MIGLAELLGLSGQDELDQLRRAAGQQYSGRWRSGRGSVSHATVQRRRAANRRARASRRINRGTR